jgi:hypothetical protein
MRQFKIGKVNGDAEWKGNGAGTEIEAALRQQMKAIQSSSAAFDQGEKWEACRLATAVVNIVPRQGPAVLVSWRSSA